ncbi:MAG: Hsp20/alpha crystallin family protein [Candidatus Liptonbacteria bacterium]
MATSEEKFFEDLAKFGAKRTSSFAQAAEQEDKAETEPEEVEIVATAAKAEKTETATFAVEKEDEEPAVELAKASMPSNYKVPKSASKSQVDSEMAMEGSLTIDVFQTPSDLVVQSAIAGVRPEDIDIEVSTDSITIRGARHKEQEVEDNDYYYQECYWGRFSRQVLLPQEIDPEAAAVTFKNGILTIKLPKLNRKKSRKLKVKTD